MNKFSRISLAAMTCGALCLNMAQVHAQSGTQPGALGGVSGSQNPADPAYGTDASGATSGGMSNTMGTQTQTQGRTYDPTLSGTGSAPDASVGNTTNNRYNANQAAANNFELPTEPTAAGYGTDAARYSWIPYTTAGFIKLGIGNGSLNVDCAAGQECDDPRGSVSLSTGGMFTPYVGLQLGYFRLGDADRNGGKTKVSGATIALTGVMPIAYNFSLVGRAGGTYAWTDVTAGAGVATPTGEEEGFGPSYGVGLSWDFHPNWSITLDWDRHHIKFANIDGKKKTEFAALGIKYRF